MKKIIFKEINDITDTSNFIKFAPIAEVLTPKEQSIVRALYAQGKLTPHNCHYNSALIAGVLGIEYCEGRLDSIVPTSHAFNKVRGKYIDVTTELVNNMDVRKRKANLYRVFKYENISQLFSKEERAFITFDCYDEETGKYSYYDKYGDKHTYTDEEHFRMQYANMPEFINYFTKTNF